MKDIQLEYRMYGLVPYNLSPIQQGIQFGHAVQEYNNKMFDELFQDKLKKDFEKREDFYPFQKWANSDKTFIILNGGTTNAHRALSTGIPEGTLNKHCDALQDANIPIAWFTEPDLGNQLTAVVFLVDERVWDKEKYPNRFLGGNPEPDETGAVQTVYLSPETEEHYIERLGGEKNVWLREFLSQFKLA